MMRGQGPREEIHEAQNFSAGYAGDGGIGPPNAVLETAGIPLT